MLIEPITALTAAATAPLDLTNTALITDTLTATKNICRARNERQDRRNNPYFPASHLYKHFSHGRLCKAVGRLTGTENARKCIRKGIADGNLDIKFYGSRSTDNRRNGIKQPHQSYYGTMQSASEKPRKTNCVHCIVWKALDKTGRPLELRTLCANKLRCCYFELLSKGKAPTARKPFWKAPSTQQDFGLCQCMRLRNEYSNCSSEQHRNGNHISCSVH